jgi:hypothetical protein
MTPPPPSVDYYFANQIIIILKKIKIEMKSINMYARLVNIVLAFSELSPLIIGQKSKFYSN